MPMAAGQNNSAAVAKRFTEQTIRHSRLNLVIMYIMLSMSIMWIMSEIIDDGNLTIGHAPYPDHEDKNVLCY